MNRRILRRTKKQTYIAARLKLRYIAMQYDVDVRDIFQLVLNVIIDELTMSNLTVI